MSPDLVFALTILIYQLGALTSLLFIKVMSGDFDRKGNTVKVIGDGSLKKEDNIYTVQAAKEFAKAAEETRRTEEIRLQRTDLDKVG